MSDATPGKIAKHTKRVTNDGEDLVILNGASDWAYEEEIYESAQANFWSPDGRSLAYVKFQFDQVPEYQFPIYSQNRTYPGTYSYKYPCVCQIPLRASLISKIGRRSQFHCIFVGFRC